MKKVTKNIKLIIIVSLAVIMTSCTSGEKIEQDSMAETISNVPVKTPTPTLTPEDEILIDPIGYNANKVQSPYTGIMVSEEIANSRAYAVVINNFRGAMPASGVSQADIYYETMAEGDITRIVALFNNFNSEKIGPIRSTRHYFIDFAIDNRAIFVHHGGSPQGYSSIASTGIDNIDGMSVSGDVFWRDRTGPNGTTRSLEHSSYTSSSQIKATAVNKGYETEVLDDYESLFNFYDEFELPENALSGEAEKVVIPFSQNYMSIFDYNADEKLYYRAYSSEELPYMDDENGTHVSVTNIILQFTDIYQIAGDTEGRKEVVLTGSGEGYLVTGGTFAPITWEKDSRSGQTSYYDVKNEKLTLNKGKTWIAVYNNKYKVEFNGE